jgi:hypothetical protein
MRPIPHLLTIRHGGFMRLLFGHTVALDGWAPAVGAEGGTVCANASFARVPSRRAMMIIERMTAVPLRLEEVSRLLTVPQRQRAAIGPWFDWAPAPYHRSGP